MTGQKWEPTKRDAKRLNDFIRKGTTVYTITDNVKSELYDPHCYVPHTFTHRAPFTGNWLAGHLSAQQLLAQEGTVYEHQPSGMRRVGDPGPSCLDEFDLAQIRGAGRSMGWHGRS